MGGLLIVILVLIALFFVGRFLYRRFVDRTTSKNIKLLISVLGACILLFLIILIISFISQK